MRLIIKRPIRDDQRHEELDTDAVQSRKPIHLLPCKIQKRKLMTDDNNQTLSAAVDRYFRPFVLTSAAATAVPESKADTKDSTDQANSLDTTANLVDVTAKSDPADTTKLWHSTFRGKPLTGVELGMPDGYVGVLCSNSEVNQDQNSVSDVNLTADCEITRELMYWNWDRVPTREDPLLAAFDWVRVSEAMMANTM